MGRAARAGALSFEREIAAQRLQRSSGITDCRLRRRCDLPLLEKRRGGQVPTPYRAPNLRRVSIPAALTGEPFLLAPIRVIAASWLSEDPRVCEDLLVGVCSIRPTRTSICREGYQTYLVTMLTTAIVPAGSLAEIKGRVGPRRCGSRFTRP